MKVIKVRIILRDLRKDGWVLVKQKGSHRQFRHPKKNGKVTVNGAENDDIWGDLLDSIENQSGLVF